MIRTALRAIARMPGVALVVVFSLGVGIGVNTAVFTWIQTVLLRPLPGVAGGGSTFHLIEARAETGTFPGSSWLEYQDLAARAHAFKGLMAFRPAPLNIGEAGRVERVFGMLVSGNYFAELGLRPALGRFLAADDVAKPGGAPAAVISYDYWKNRYRSAHGRDRPDRHRQQPDADNRGGRTRSVPGDDARAAVRPLGAGDDGARAAGGIARTRGSQSARLFAHGRVARRRHLVQAQTEVTAAMSELAQAFPEIERVDARRGRGVRRRAARAAADDCDRAPDPAGGDAPRARSSLRQHRQSRARPRQHARPRGRRSPEPRCGPGRIVRLMLVENVILALMGSALGIVIAMWGTNALRAMPAYGAFPIRFQTSVDGMGLLFAIGLGIACGLLFGAAPALQLGRIDPQQALRAGVEGRQPQPDA